MKKNKQVLKIGVVGAGFAGTSLTALLHRMTDRPIEVVLCEKTGNFGAGPAYSTPYPFHLLNVRAGDMSAFHDAPAHFVSWLTMHQDTDRVQPVGEQFVSRRLYGRYLKSLLDQVQVDHSGKIKFTLVPTEVVDVIPFENQAMLILAEGRKFIVDKVVLALGNHLSTTLPFPISAAMRCIANPWDYTALKQIPQQDPVLIMGTGLSMIDAVLTLYHQQHQAEIYAVSRHGLLPLPHGDTHLSCTFESERIPDQLRTLTQYMRSQSQSFMEKGGDWRSVIQTFRQHIPRLWEKSTLIDKKRFLRHVLPYWNIHRHRVHETIANLLATLRAKNQLRVVSGRVLSVQDGIAQIKLRHQHEIISPTMKWVINCIGPAMDMRTSQNPLIQSLLQRDIAAFDPLNLGFAISPIGALKNKREEVSSMFYTLGPPCKGVTWECTAVPEIRVQSFNLAKHLLDEC